jgi:hypothetical protein
VEKNISSRRQRIEFSPRMKRAAENFTDIAAPSPMLSRYLSYFVG